MDTGTAEQLHTLDEGQKIKALGGKTKAALFDAGMLAHEDYFRPLKDIDLSNIKVPDPTTMRHVIIGEYKMANPPDPLFPNGRLNKDGHTIQAMEEMEYCPDLLAKYQKKIEGLSKNNSQDAWEVFMSGTNEEFTALVNLVGYIGEEFNRAENRREIMRQVKKRNTNDIIQAARASFGSSFDQVWGEIETVAKTRTFGQVRQAADSVQTV